MYLTVLHKFGTIIEKNCCGDWYIMLNIISFVNQQVLPSLEKSGKYFVNPLSFKV